MSQDSPQKPVSKPTAKQELSLLKVAESENGPTDSSITCRVFILQARNRGHESSRCRKYRVGRKLEDRQRSLTSPGHQ